MRYIVNRCTAFLGYRTKSVVLNRELAKYIRLIRGFKLFRRRYRVDKKCWYIVFSGKVHDIQQQKPCQTVVGDNSYEVIDSCDERT